MCFHTHRGRVNYGQLNSVQILTFERSGSAALADTRSANTQTQILPPDARSVSFGLHEFGFLVFSVWMTFLYIMNFANSFRPHFLRRLHIAFCRLDDGRLFVRTIHERPIPHARYHTQYDPTGYRLLHLPCPASKFRFWVACKILSLFILHRCGVGKQFWILLNALCRNLICML